MRRRLQLPLVALLAAAALLASACSSGGDDEAVDTADLAQPVDGADDAYDAGDAGDMAVGLSAAQGDGREAGQPTPAPAADEEGGDAAGSPEDQAPAEPVAVPPADGTAATGERIIKEGTVTLRVEPGDFDTAFSQVVSRAQALGGHVSGTSSSTTPADTPGGPVLTSGQVTIRIPVRSFEGLLTSLGQAGEITDRAITSQDVTAEFTDLESRRRNLQAQERFYLDLLDQAADIQDAIAVQQQLDDVTAQIEQITGRLNLLADRSAFSTLTVRIAERGAEATEVAQEEPTGLLPYVREAGDTLIATVGSLLVVLTFLLPFLVLAGLGYGTWRAVRRRRPTAQDPEPEVLGPPLVTSGAPPGAADADRG